MNKIVNYFGLVYAMQMVQKFVIETDLKKMEVEYASIQRPAGNVSLYLRDRQ